jgi:tetratricopeptide (TPR) repeat protein
MMIRITAFPALLGALAATFGIWVLPDPPPLLRAAATLMPKAAPQAGPAEFESWPICKTSDFNEGPAWAPLAPDVAAGKRALAASDWDAAIAALAPLALRDDRNADVHNYLGYAYRRLRRFDEALWYYQQATALNPRHRSAHEHLGEAYLALGNTVKAEEHLAALGRSCLIPCQEYEDLKRAIIEYRRIAWR